MDAPSPPKLATLGYAGVAEPIEVQSEGIGVNAAGVAALATSDATVVAPHSAVYPAPFTMLCESSVLTKILELARAIRMAGNYTGHIAFVLFGLLRKRRPYVWEGPYRKDLIQAYAPWACDLCSRACTVDAITCCAGFNPVSEKTPSAQVQPLGRRAQGRLGFGVV